MQLYRLSIETKTPVGDHRAVDDLRGALIETAKRSGAFVEDELRLINFRPPKPYNRHAPTILYAQPSGGSFFEVFGYGEDGRTILDKMGKVLVGFGSLKVSGRKVAIESWRLTGEWPFLPLPLPAKAVYDTLTPIVVHDKRRDYREWHAITCKFKESDPAEYDRQMKRSVANLVRANIAWQLRTRVADKPWDFVRDIPIEIESFSERMVKYHKEQPPAPAFFMRFRSDWELPMFVGHHTGKGYGRLKMRKEAR